jgi:hypothetical protein
MRLIPLLCTCQSATPRITISVHLTSQYVEKGAVRMDRPAERVAQVQVVTYSRFPTDSYWDLCAARHPPAQRSFYVPVAYVGLGSSKAPKSLEQQLLHEASSPCHSSPLHQQQAFIDQILLKSNISVDPFIYRQNFLIPS